MLSSKESVSWDGGPGSLSVSFRSCFIVFFFFVLIYLEYEARKMELATSRDSVIPDNQGANTYTLI